MPEPSSGAPSLLHLYTKGWQPVAPAAVSSRNQRLRSVVGRGRCIKLEQKLKSWSQRSHLSRGMELTPWKFQLGSQEKSQHPSDCVLKCSLSTTSPRQTLQVGRTPRELVGSEQLGESPPGFFTHPCLFQAFLRLARAGNVPHFSCKADLGATAKG